MTPIIPIRLETVLVLSMVFDGLRVSDAERESRLIESQEVVLLRETIANLAGSVSD
ncbi:MAG: hypothetical protein AAGG48_10595 [Planctomycetota bacterium]